MADNNKIYIPKVTVRKKKFRTDTYSLFLDIYNKGVHMREYLELYIIPETSRKDKLLNMKTYAEAAKIRDEREFKLMNPEESSEVEFHTDMPFLEFYCNIMESRKEKYSVSEITDWKTA